MTLDTATGVLAAVCAAIGAAGGYLTRARQSAREEGGVQAELRHIARGLDDLRVETRAQGREQALQGQRLARVEEALHSRGTARTESERQEEYVS